MTLEEYLKLNNLSLDDFAAKMGTRRLTVQRWIQGEFMPQRRHLEKIVKITGGKVTANSFLCLAA